MLRIRDNHKNRLAKLLTKAAFCALSAAAGIVTLEAGSATLGSITLLALATTAHAEVPGGSGGGNEVEGNFVTIAREILSKLNKNPKQATEVLSLEISEYEKIIDKTEVACAVGDTLQIMRDLKKNAYYLSNRKSINLDCENYYKAKSTGELGQITVFHEYMRALGKEGSEYGTSSKLFLALQVLGFTEEPSAIDPSLRLCYNENNISHPLISSTFEDVLEMELGRSLVKCLFKQGFTKKSDKEISSGAIIQKLGRQAIRGQTIFDFSNLVNSLMSRE